MSNRRSQHREEDSDKLPVLGEDGRGSAGGYYNNNHVRNKPTGYRAFPSSSRPGSGSRRTPTPTKQIALQAVRRKDDVVKEPFDDVDLAELNSTLKLESEKSFLERENSNTDLKKGDGASGFTVKLPNGYGSGARPKDSPSKTTHHSDTDSWEKETTKSVPNSKTQQKPQGSKSSKVEDSSKTEDSSDDDDDDDEDEDDPASWQEGDNKTAPMQLMMEFIGCLMQGDYPNAAKLCKMILMYEPTNAEALKFQPLINEKIELDAQPDAESGSGESGSEDETDDEEDEGNSDDDSDSDDSDDDSDASDNSSSEAENEGEKADSGISSGLSGSNSNSEME